MKNTAWTMATIAAIVGLYFADFKIWRLMHPDAPGWTYLFR